MAKIKTTKRQLLNLVENTECKTINLVVKSWDNKILQAKKGLLHTKGYDARIEKLQGLTNELHIFASNLFQDLKDDVEVRHSSDYNTLPRKLSEFIGSNTILEDIIEDSYFDGGLAEKLENQKQDELNVIQQQYANVKANIESFSSIKAAAEYLESIGFDLSKFKIPETALVANVDVSKLFFKEVE